MAAANAHYYATRDPLGTGGDFVTAPEISQMFGELVGACLADLRVRAGRPEANYVELGPGRGTLAADALRVMAKAQFAPSVDLVETSPVLRTLQRAQVPAARWHDDPSSLPSDRPLLIVANEFFDALPVHQLLKAGDGWHERRIAGQNGVFVPVAGPLVPEAVIPESMRDAPVGGVLETSPKAVAMVRALTRIIVAQGGILLIIDYGYDGPELGETLQAVKGHRSVNPFEAPGGHDLTAHVDFTTLAAMAMLHGARVIGPVSQGDFLQRLGIVDRAAALARAQPSRGHEIAEAYRRLTHAEEMGSLFRVMAIVAPGWPDPAGFA
jgi:NADH dehydrogenase [ubiquinone] 1 alpha subcomplex assembly factor 7